MGTGAVSCANEAPAQSRVVFALPAATLTSASVFVAHDLGLFTKHRIDVTVRTIAGVAAPNAVMSGDAHFTLGTAAVFLRAAAQQQRFLAIANVLDRPLVELVIAPAVARARGMQGDAPLAQRALTLKGLTIGIQGVGSATHAWTRYVARAGGLDVERDVRVAPLDPSGMRVALRDGHIDGFVTSPPFTTEALQAGSATLLASSLTDAPELLPFGYGLIYARPDTCERASHICAGMARALAEAVRLIHERPEEIFAKVVQPRFSAMPSEVLQAAWASTRRAHAQDVHVRTEQFENAQRVNLQTLLLKPELIVTDYAGLYTNRFLDE